MVTTGVYQGEPREFSQKIWFRKSGTYRFETNQDYQLITIVDPVSIRHYIGGGDWRGRGPLMIVRPRSQAALPFPFGITWPAGPNMTLDSLVSQLQATRDVDLLDDGSAQGRSCYRLQFEATPPGGRRPEQCTMWLARDPLLPLRIQRYRDVDNHTDTRAEPISINAPLPSNVFDFDAPPGTLEIHGDVDPHVFALKPEWDASFNSDPLSATRQQVIKHRAIGVPFLALAPTYLTPGYHLVRARASRGRWLDIHWIDDRPGAAARAMRLMEQNEGDDDPPEVRGGEVVQLGTREDPVTARVVERPTPYPHCYVAWREHGALLTLSTAEMSLEDTLRIARSMRIVPLLKPAQPQIVGPPAPEGTSSNAASSPTPEPAAKKIEINIAPSATEPPMVPETPEDDHAGGSNGK